MNLEQINNPEYLNWVSLLKEKIQKAQLKTAISINTELLDLYWELGSSISNKIKEANWGTSIVEELSKSLKSDFPTQKGFSRSNLFSMKKWVEFYSSESQETKKFQQLVGQIPWGHNILIISKAKSIEEALFYCKKTIEHNWSRSILTLQIKSSLYSRKGKAISNFKTTLPSPHSELATETLKDPYKFDFLNLQEKVLEKDIEKQLVKNITSFLLELGEGFSFVGQQVPIKIDQNDFYLDLLFYHIKLRCYIVIELKTTEFKAEFAGKLNLYLSAVDDILKTEGDNPTIGLLLCQSKSKIIAEYALRGMTQPIGIAEYEFNNIFKTIESKLPTIEKIETELTTIISEK